MTEATTGATPDAAPGATPGAAAGAAPGGVRTVRAAVLDPAPVLAPGRGPVEVRPWPVSPLEDGEVRVRVHRAALNHLDVLNVRARTGFDQPSVLGSDAAGVVEEVGPGVNPARVGEEVVVLPSLGWGGSERAPDPGFRILGDPDGGTLAEVVTVPATGTRPRPAGWSWDEAAALPLAGLTAWRALVTCGELRAGETVVVTAASSGVGTFLVQQAVALGAQVVAVTSTPARMAAVRALGAHEVLSRDPASAHSLANAVTGQADLVVDSTGDWSTLLPLLRRGGRLVSLGKTATVTAEVDVRRVFWEHLRILGSSMGSPADFDALLRHVASTDWRPVVDSVHPLSAVAAAFERQLHPDRVGKVVVDPAR